MIVRGNYKNIEEMETICRHCKTILNDNSKFNFYEISENIFKNILVNFEIEKYKLISIFNFLNDGNLLIIKNGKQKKIIYINNNSLEIILKSKTELKINQTIYFYDLFDNFEISKNSKLLDLFYEHSMYNGFLKKLNNE